MAKLPIGYKKLEDLRPHISEFKEFYYREMLKEEASNPSKLLGIFNEEHPDYEFRPYPNQYRKWRAMWDIEINAKRMAGNLALLPDTDKETLVMVRDDKNKLLASPPTQELEEGTRTLGGELLNDALAMLKDDQQRGEEIYDDDILIKRRKHILNVYNFVSRNAMASETLKIKQQANQRENTNFIMDLLRRSTAGKISEEEMSLLRGSVKADAIEVEPQPV